MAILKPLDGKELNPDFLDLISNILYEPARDVINNIFETYHDKDGNFIEQFQTGGFTQRLWELLLHQVLLSEGFIQNTDFEMPDFQVVKNGTELFIEATTSNPSKKGDISSGLLEIVYSDKPEETRKDAFEKLKDYYIEKIGSCLYSKQKEKYQEREHVKNKPLVFAVSPLHDDFAKRNSDSLLFKYLYGLEHEAVVDEEGKLLSVDFTPKAVFTKINEAEIQPFFEAENSEFVSAVIFFNDVTIDKFNRMGYLSSSYDNILIARNCDLYDPEGAVPKSIYYLLSADSPIEDWKQGFTVYHNPNAVKPLDHSVFDGFRQIWLENGKLAGIMPDFFPFTSLTVATTID